MPEEQEPPPMSIAEIDPDALDIHWIKQPKLVYRYALKLAAAKLDLADAKNNLEIVKADLDKSIREDPENYGCSKLTEKAVENCVLSQGAYRRAVRDVNKSKHTVDVLEAAILALEHKKRALENLVTLHGQNYFSSPKVTGAGREAGEEMDRRASRNKVKIRNKE